MKQSKSMAWSVGSMVCGILGCAGFLMPYFALPLSVTAIVLRCKNKDSAMSTTGLVCGIIGIVLNVAVLLFIAGSMAVLRAIGI